MFEWTLALALFCVLLRYIWVSLHREPVEDFDADPVAAIDSIRAALPVEVRSSDFAALDAANHEVTRRPRVAAMTSPLPNLKGTSTS